MHLLLQLVLSSSDFVSACFSSPRKLACWDHSTNIASYSTFSVGMRCFFHIYGIHLFKLRLTQLCCDIVYLGLYSTETGGFPGARIQKQYI